MIPLDKDLQETKRDLSEFGSITTRILRYLPNVLSGYEDKNDYRIYSSQIAGTTKYLRPINKSMFLQNEHDFLFSFNELKKGFVKIKNKSTLSVSEKRVIDRTLYTIQQAIGAGLDLLVKPNSARKHVGNRFEELIKVIFSEIGIANKKIVLQIPYKTDEGQKTYKCENDLVISPYSEVKSTSFSLEEKEIVLSVKTTSKDRMGKVFIDKILLERFVGHPQKVMGVFLNDVQRKATDNISFTLVSGLFMVYTKFLTPLDGVYYFDLPPNAKKKPFSKYMKAFSELLAEDIWSYLSS